MLARLPVAHAVTPQQGPCGPKAGPTQGWEQALGHCGRSHLAVEQLLGPKAVPPLSLAGPMLSLEQSLKPLGTHAHSACGRPFLANAIHEHIRAHLRVIASSISSTSMGSTSRTNGIS